MGVSIVKIVHPHVGIWRYHNGKKPYNEFKHDDWPNLITKIKCLEICPHQTSPWRLQGSTNMLKFENPLYVAWELYAPQINSGTN